MPLEHAGVEPEPEPGNARPSRPRDAATSWRVGRRTELVDDSVLDWVTDDESFPRRRIWRLCCPLRCPSGRLSDEDTIDESTCERCFSRGVGAGARCGELEFEPELIGDCAAP